MNEASKNKRGWRIVRRILIGLAILATLIAIFYTEEDWRGKRAWENCKRDLEAKGMVLDWGKYIPPPVPDDQNFFTANTNIFVRFRKLTVAEHDAATNTLNNGWLRIDYSPNAFPALDTANLLVANISILPQGTAPRDLGTNSLAVTLHDPAAPQRVRGLLQSTVGQSMNGAAGFKFSQFQLTELQPAHIIVQAEKSPAVSDLEALIPPDTATNIGLLHVELAPGSQNVFQILSSGGPITSAADFLKWSDQFEPAFDEIREALKRPYAILPGDYSQPVQIPIPNFVIMRSVAQMLAQRAQCHFLLGEPDKALPDVVLMHDICRILEKPPTGKPMTLVEAMINVAISGLYANTIADGLRLHTWQAPQLAALQEQLNGINLPPLLADALEMEQASSTYTLETTRADKLADLIDSPGSKNPQVSFWKHLHNPVYWLLKFAPRGWVYQNMVAVAVLEQKPLTGFDVANNVVSPRRFDDANRDTEHFVHRITPYRILAEITIPNFVKAEQATARNQTLVNEAQIACALERYHLAHGEYPESLDALMPQFMEKLPHDLIGGQPLHYRRTPDGKFLLYSIGWNETDDGGVPSPPAKNGGTDFAQGDWVWQN
ncbi:MAG: hypothetical protein ABSE16_08145 [Verrucomicrobiota bacterium]